MQDSHKNIPVTRFDKDIVSIAGTLRISWVEKDYPTVSLTELDLSRRIKQSFNALGLYDRGSSEWIRARNTHYSAEHGLDRLQQRKLEENIKLDVPRAPLVK